MWTWADTCVIKHTHNALQIKQDADSPFFFTITFTHGQSSACCYTSGQQTPRPCCRVEVLTLCQSGRWSTQGGRGRLNPCPLCHHAVKGRKMCPRTSVSLCLSCSSAPPPLDYLLETVSLTALFVTFFLIQPPRSLSPSTAPLSPSQALSLPLRLSSCHFHFSPTAPGCWLPLKSWLLWLRLAACDKGLQAKPALMNTQPHHLNGLPPEDWAGSWLAVLGANEWAYCWARWMWQQRM